MLQTRFRILDDLKNLPIKMLIYNYITILIIRIFIVTHFVATPCLDENKFCQQYETEHSNKQIQTQCFRMNKLDIASI